MKKFSSILKFVLTAVLCLMSVVSFAACDLFGSNGDNSEEAPTSVNAKTEKDYVLPENLYMKLQISDTSIFNKGDPWYPKTAKIGNDWQIILYDRDLADKTQQETYFFKYLSANNYRKYGYEYEMSSWEELATVTFNEMVLSSGINFSFLYTKRTENYLNIVETECTFDTDPTSNENLIDAIKLEYTDGMCYEFIVDKDYQNVRLYDVERDNSTICVANKAYIYSKNITDWATIDNTPNTTPFKPAPDTEG